MFSYVNNIPTPEGGTHEMGFKTAFTKAFNDYARKIGVLKDKDANLSGEDKNLKGMLETYGQKLDSQSLLIEELKKRLDAPPAVTATLGRRRLPGEPRGRSVPPAPPPPGPTPDPAGPALRHRPPGGRRATTPPRAPATLCARR